MQSFGFVDLFKVDDITKFIYHYHLILAMKYRSYFSSSLASGCNITFQFKTSCFFFDKIFHDFSLLSDERNMTRENEHTRALYGC